MILRGCANDSSYAAVQADTSVQQHVVHSISEPVSVYPHAHNNRLKLVCYQHSRLLVSFNYLCRCSSATTTTSTALKHITTINPPCPTSLLLSCQCLCHRHQWPVSQAECSSARVVSTADRTVPRPNKAGCLCNTDMMVCCSAAAATGRHTLVHSLLQCQQHRRRYNSCANGDTTLK
jgi:hypothetical protein